MATAPIKQDIVRTSTSESEDEDRTSETETPTQFKTPAVDTPTQSITTTATINDNATVRIPVNTDSVSVQVEDLIRESTVRIKPFSGLKTTEFPEWARQAELILEDTSLPEKAKRQKLLQSLVCPAHDLIKTLGNISSKEILDECTDLYGPASNGVKLFQEFFSSRREATETASQYLRRLGVKIGQVKRCGGLQEGQINETVFNHFISSCECDVLKQFLLSRFSGDDTPTLHNLIKVVRRAEDSLDIKLPSNSTRKEKSQSHVHVATPSPGPEITQILEGMRSMQAQINSLTEGKPKGRDTTRKFKPKTHDRRFCYNCGQDDHLKNKCTNTENPTLVFKKLNERASLNKNGPR
ncbi:hypothetical protein SNE40_012481 [Patella caerulea]|uniref:CCHC-type domain-containing protein n=1 Tax=Patella caerulea TaxID=87958 RepID=A0AAN8PMQ7_PATCE